jgi:hypothetical protein
MENGGTFNVLANVTIIKMNLPKKIMEEKVCCNCQSRYTLKPCLEAGK